jgi:hypothetical protein
MGGTRQHQREHGRGTQCNRLDRHFKILPYRWPSAMHELLRLIIAPTNESQAEICRSLQGNFSDVILLPQDRVARFSGMFP